MQVFIRSCANQFQYAPAGVEAWATGSGPADPEQISMTVTLTANDAGAVTVNGVEQSLPYVVQAEDVVAGIGGSGGTMTFSALVDDAAAIVQAVSGETEFPASVSDGNPAVVTIRDVIISGSDNFTNLSISARKDNCVSAALQFGVAEPQD